MVSLTQLGWRYHSLPLGHGFMKFRQFHPGIYFINNFLSQFEFEKNHIVVIGLPAITKPSSCVMYKTFYSE